MEEVKKIAITELTDTERAEYEAKAEAIRKEKKLFKVYPVVFVNPETNARVVCYLQEPNYISKVNTINEASERGPMFAAENLRQIVVLKAESDDITYGDTPHCDPYKLGVANYIVQNMISVFVDQYKKK